MLPQAASLDATAAFILAGGLGTRLRVSVNDRPKVLAPVGGRPWLAYLLEQLVDAGIRQAVIGTGYLGDQVEQAFGAAYGPLALIYSREPEPLGTAGAIRFALPKLVGAATVLVLNGDSYCDVDIRRFVRWHLDRKANASLLLTPVRDATRFGTVETEQDGRVTAFLEKAPTPSLTHEAIERWVSAGMYAVQPSVIESIPSERSVSIERETFPSYVGQGLYGLRAGGRFIDMGLPESFEAAQRFFPVGARPAALLDRDGTIIAERNYLADPEGVELLPKAVEGLRRLRALGLSLVVVSNQSGVGRGYMDARTVDAVHARMGQLLDAQGVHLDGVFYCPHTPDAGCGCRKPATGLAHRAARELGFSLSRSIVIGDKACDMDLGRRLGLPTILVTTGHGTSELAKGTAGDAVVPDLLAAANVVKEILG